MMERIYLITGVTGASLLLVLILYHAMQRVEHRRLNQLNKFRYSRLYAKISPMLSVICNYAIESLHITSEGIVVNFLLADDAGQMILNFKTEGLTISNRTLKSLADIIEEDIQVLSDFSKYKYSKIKREACNGKIKHEFSYRIRPSYRKTLEYYANNDLCVHSAVQDFNG